MGGDAPETLRVINAHTRDAPGGSGASSERGFTLVEVMMVVLILGILLSVGIPTFVGARNRAHDAAASSNLATAATAAVILGNFGSDFETATPSALAPFEPSLTYVEASVESTSPSEVSVDTSTPDRWTGTVRSNSGKCLSIELSAQGRSSFESASCTAGPPVVPVAPTPTNVALTSAATAAGGTNGANAVDGDFSTVGNTGWLGAQWFSFDLASNTAISEIVLWNRTDCCWGRTRDLTIFVSENPISTNLATARASGAPSFSHPGAVGNPSTMPTNATGRYVVIFGSGPNTAFQEVEIVGIPG